MTPKEKAEDLVNKFYNYVFNPESHKDDNLKWTKECALIAVDEVIEQNNIWINQTGKGTNNYWKLVKEEINNL
jgi:hypothetical protein